MLLSPGEFLNELDKLFQKTKEKGNIYIVMKRSTTLAINSTSAVRGTVILQ